MLDGDGLETAAVPPLRAVDLPRVRAAQEWLATHPEADVGALGANALPQALPPEIQLGAGHRTAVCSLLDIVDPADHQRIAVAYTTARRYGQGSTAVHLAAEPDQSAVVHYLDLNPDLPACLRLLTRDATASAPDAVRSGPIRSRAGLIIKDDASRILSVDDGLVGLLGWDVADLVGKSTLEFIHPDDHARAADNWMSMMLGSGPQSVRLRYRCRDQSWVWLETSNSFRQDALGNRNVSCQVIDISDEMSAQDALRRNEQLLRRLTETVPVGLCYLSPDRSTSHVNPGMASLLGTADVTDLAGLVALLHPDSAGALERAATQALQAGRDSEVDVTVQRPGSAAVRCRVMLSAVFDGGAIIGALLCAVDVTELQHHATIDGLTGLHNRRAILHLLRDVLARRRSHTGVIFIDLDQFKQVNDVHGHRVGDQLLAAVADRLRTAVREADTVGRLGGDEFLVVCPDLSRPEDLEMIAERVRNSLPPAIQIGELLLATAASFGLATTSYGIHTADEVVAHADAAMYLAKQDKTRRLTHPSLTNSRLIKVAGLLRQHVLVKAERVQVNRSQRRRVG